MRYAIWSDAIWLWPNRSTQDDNALHLTYLAYDEALSADADQTALDVKFERLTVLEAAKILAGQINEDELWKRIVTDIQLLNEDIRVAGEKRETSDVDQVIDWDAGFGDDGVFF